LEVEHEEHALEGAAEHAEHALEGVVENAKSWAEDQRAQAVDEVEGGKEKGYIHCFAAKMMREKGRFQVAQKERLPVFYHVA
jgi:hypothetical protein